MPLSSAPGALSGLHQRLSWILSCPVARRCVAAQAAASSRNPLHRNQQPARTTHVQGPYPPRKAKLPPRLVRKQGVAGTQAWKHDRANSRISHGISSSLQPAALGHPHAQVLQDVQHGADTPEPAVQQPQLLQPQQQPQQEVKQQPEQAQQQPLQEQQQSSQRDQFPTRGRLLHDKLRDKPRQRLPHHKQTLPQKAQPQARKGTAYAPSSQQPVQAGRSNQHEALSVNMTGVLTRFTSFPKSDWKVLKFASKQVRVR